MSRYGGNGGVHAIGVVVTNTIDAALHILPVQSSVIADRTSSQSVGHVASD